MDLLICILIFDCLHGLPLCFVRISHCSIPSCSHLALLSGYLGICVAFPGSSHAGVGCSVG